MEGWVEERTEGVDVGVSEGWVEDCSVGVLVGDWEVLGLREEIRVGVTEGLFVGLIVKEGCCDGRVLGGILLGTLVCCNDGAKLGIEEDSTLGE